MRVAVAGATGMVGKQVIGLLRERGIDTVAISRQAGVDLTTGAGLDAALSGVNRLIDVTNSPEKEEQAATTFFRTAAERLQRSAHAHGVERIVLLSIIGVDQFTHGYYAAKRRQEESALGPVSVVILRSAQFHEYARQVLEWGRNGTVCRVQEMLVQPVAVRNVAQVLVDFAIDPRVDKDVVEVAGPRRESLVDMARRVLAARGDSCRLEAFQEHSPDGEAATSGALLPKPDALLVGPTFEQWLNTFAFEAFLEQRKAVSDAYVQGDAEPLSRIVARENPATFFPPGGGFTDGAAQVASRYERDAHAFAHGSNFSFEVLQSAAGDEVAYWVGLMRGQARMQGKAEPVAMQLRVTEIFRRENGVWKLVHRHADPLADEPG